MGEPEGILDGLNDPQRAAVCAVDGPVLVIAGAGSGKTRVLTRRIAYLISQGVPPGAILAITFTNKAAQEMVSRLRSLVLDVADEVWASTFHSACVRILRRDPSLGGLKPGFVIYDAQDATRLCERVIRGMELDTKRFPARAILATISAAKSRMESPEDVASLARGAHGRFIAEIYAEYERQLISNNASDFDNLINHVVAGFQAHPEVLEYYRNRFRYILVDEYQDTNPAQNRLVFQLGGATANVFVVGDTDQAIYGFRGADITNMLAFEDQYPGAKVIPLEQNYRSTQSILELANSLIRHNQARHRKELWSELGEGERPRFYLAVDDRDEADYVVSLIDQLNSRSQMSYRDMAVMYRTNSQSRVIEEQLARRGIPYRVYGGLRFYDRREIKDVLAYLRIIVNPDDDISLLRVINVPKRGIGQGTQEQLAVAARGRGRSIMTALGEYGPQGLGLTTRAERQVTKFLELYELLVEEARGEASALEVLDRVLEVTQYREAVLEEDAAIAETRLENLDELRKTAAQEESLESFLEHTALFSTIDEFMEDSAVTLMTVHMAKGLEFPAVFVVGLEDGVFPHMRALTNPSDVEEERRLLYVAMTRAKSRLFLSAARRRMSLGGQVYNPRSRFLTEAPKELLDQTENSQGDFAESTNLSWATFETPASKGSKYHEGETVYHSRYGEGTIVAVTPKSFDFEIAIEFPSYGERRFFESIVSLKKLGHG